jgi:hypothetical protein
MSLEAWGDEGNVGPEGYVTEELFDELTSVLREAVDLLQRALPALHHESLTIHEAIAQWLAENTVDGKIP